MSAESLSAYLRDHGLENTDFWLPEFEQLGISSVAALESLDNKLEMLAQIEEKATSDSEKRAIHKIFKNSECKQNEPKENEKKAQGKEQNSDIDDWKEKAEELLKVLDEIRSQEKISREEASEKIESELSSLPVPLESWIVEDKTVAELMKRIESHISAKKAESIGEILQTCSGGRALQGIFLSNNLDDQLKDREYLLKVPNKVRLAEEEMDDIIMKHFSSTPDEDRFKKTIEILGHDIAAPNTIPIYGNAKATYETSETAKQEVEGSENQMIYSSTVKSFVTRLASFSFNRSTLELSDKACSELSELLNIIKSRGEFSIDAQEKCKQFFTLFGSHVTLGPLTYGGYIIWTCSNTEFLEVQRETIKSMQENAVSINPNDLFDDVSLLEDIKRNFTGTDVEHTVAKTKLQMRIYGGSSKCTSLVEWKSKLSENSRAWVLTDRGRRLMAVWDIIKRNHDTEFGAVTNVLQNAWENITGLTAEKDIVELSSKSEIVLEQISLWNKGEELTPEEILDRLKYLLKIKREVTIMESQQYWVREYLTDTKLQYFLLSIMKLETDSCTLEDIQFVMKELFNQHDLSQLCAQCFRSISKLSDWLYPKEQKHTEVMNNISNFSSFIAFLKKKVAVITNPSTQIPHDGLAKDVELGVQQLRLCYYKTYEDVLITILVYPHQCSNTNDVIRFKPLLPKNLVELQESFSKETGRFEKYRSDIFHLQVYLLLLIIEQHHMNYKKLIKHAALMMKKLQPPIEEKLLVSINKHLHQPSLSAKFKPMLESLLTSSHYDFTSSTVSCKENPQSLRNLLQNIATNSKPFNNPEKQLLLWNKNPKAHALLNKIGLMGYYPKNLELREALCINEKVLELSLSGNSLTDFEQLSHLVLHKIMSYDPNSLSDLTSQIQNSEEDDDDYENENDEESADNDDEDEEGDAFFDAPSDFIEETITNIHPVDSLLALILCSDDFLRQDLFSRLAKCQRAIPFIIPDPFTKELTLPLWAMFSIIQEWKSIGKNKNIAEQIHHMVSYPMPVISFVRFGVNHDRISKSKILNDVISESESPHNYFFNRDCPGGQYKRILGNGFIDITWYLPTGKGTDLFSDAIAFLNLHGDARQYPKQTNFLSQISSMCFILITEENLEYDAATIDSLEKFMSSSGGIVILNAVAQKPVALKKVIPKLTITDLIKRNSASEIKKAVRQKMKSKIENFEGLKTIENCVKGTGLVSIDDESKLYKEGLIRVQRLMDIIGSHKNPNIGIKEAMLPLQGETLWRAWAFYDKELHRQIERGKETVNEYSSTMEVVKDSIRNDQLKHIDSLTPLTALFIKSLLSLGGSFNRALRNYFLQCLKLSLNTLSRETMSILRYKYQSVRKQLSLVQPDSKQQKSMESKRVDLKKELEIVQEDIINSSFGLEHFFRELGQVYEAALKSHEYGDELSCLPKAVAEMLIDGYPLELMDGDAAHVPLEWVNAVLKEAVEILGDPNVFVLSVLGLQSTGKSTMLNTTFGVQFNVSAGRCTRGAYMQLLPLHEEIKKKTNCSYVLVVDTEGLRAPELDPDKTQKHDNELATFVIGLANTTLINIYGEVPGDMDDILQTSVHALLRMSQVRRHPSCQFVHQNAGVNTKSEIGRAKFTQKLNRFTEDAAREEHCEDQYKCFNDVIEFDDQTDVHYFPGLWKGDPPMAPVNQGYSRAAQQLKQHFIKIICNRASKSDLSLSSFRMTVSDFWNALLREKFVFSFKNTLEITAYNSLEAAYSKWQWRLREAMLNWEHKAENVINTEPSETLSNLVTQKLAALQTFLGNEFKPIQVEMEEFFNGKQSEILIQWKAKFELRINSLLEQLKQHAEEHCNRLLGAKKAISAFERGRKRDAEEIKRKVQDHIEKIKQEQEVLRESIKHGKLKQHQLKKLLDRDLFTFEKLALYMEQKIITPEQVKHIQNIVRLCGSRLTESSLKKILSAETLSSTQVESILKTPQSEKELKIEFEKIWQDWTRHLQVVSGEAMDVAKEVEFILTEFVKGKRGYEGQLIAKLSKATLREWGLRLDFSPEGGIHYKKPGWVSYIKSVSYQVIRKKEECPDVILKMTQDILHEARCHVETTTRKETDFQVAYVLELLNLIEKRIGEHYRKIKKDFTLTFHYGLEMYLIACGSAIPAFDLMAKSFQEKSDPLKYLETKEKGPLFIKFKNQYDQIEAEEAIANSLCAYLEEPIKTQIRNLLGPKMVTKMKSSGHEYASKMALKVKVLCDLQDKTFEDYMLYVSNARLYLQTSLKLYTIAYCNEKVTKTTTRLQETAKEEVNRLVKSVQSLVTDTNEENISDWLEKFCKNQTFRSELGENLDIGDILCGCDASQQLDLDDFKLKITQRLTRLKKTLHSSYDKIECEEEMVYWKEKPHQLLQDLIGCTEQCPFCKEQCDLLDPKHVENNQKHRVAVHRLDGVCGRHYLYTGVLASGLCPERVASDDNQFHKGNGEYHHYNKYQEIYKDWSIPPDVSAKNCLYWKRFVAKYADSLEEYYGKTKPAVESHWVNIKRHEVEENLKEIYQL